MKNEAATLKKRQWKLNANERKERKKELAISDFRPVSSSLHTGNVEVMNASFLYLQYKREHALILSV